MRALYPEDLEDVILPPRDTVDCCSVNSAWDDLSVAASGARQASSLIETALHALGI
jgi:hypothetical protein